MVRSKRNIRQAMQHEVSMYACVQKDERGLDKAVEDAKYRMKRYGVTVSVCRLNLLPKRAAV